MRTLDSVRWRTQADLDSEGTFKDAPVILLDDATTSLDAENETGTRQALSRLVRGKDRARHSAQDAHGAECGQDSGTEWQHSDRAGQPGGAFEKGRHLCPHGATPE